MPENIRYATSSDREILIQVADAVNNLNERTSALCIQVDKHREQIELNKDSLSAHSHELSNIVANNALVARNTTETLGIMKTLLEKHSEAIKDFSFIARFFWWIIGAIGLLIVGILSFLIQQAIIRLLN